MKTKIQITWHDEDIKSKAYEIGYILDRHMCAEILRRIEIEYDAYIGINWEVIGNAIEKYCNDKNINKQLRETK